MGYFDGIMNEIDSIFGADLPWIQRKSNSALNIENCNGLAQEDADTNCCAMCVSVNDCYFLRDDDKKPQYPQHPNCRCKQIEKNSPSKGDVSLVFEMRKITEYLFTNSTKAGIMEAMGYAIDDAREVYNEIAKQAREQYAKGNYTFSHHDRTGYVIRLKVLLIGKRNSKRSCYHFYTGWTIYPDLKLKCNTPFVGWAEY